MKLRHLIAIALPLLAVDSGTALGAQDTGRVVGKVTLGTAGDALHGARIHLVQLSRTALTDEDGTYTIDGVPPGTYDIFAVREHLQAQRVRVEVREGETTTQDFALALLAVHEEITVTASGRATSPFDAFSTVQVMDSVELAQNMAGSLGEVLEGQPGVAKRSFGPGSSRPIIRGFDSDRVLIMQDGLRTGDLSSTSGDHGVLIDPASLERVEIIKGPATLLYGSNAIGGVVNAISPHEQFIDHPPRELRGAFTGDLGTTNEQAGANANFQYGNGSWMTWFGGGVRRAGDYGTPSGEVVNSWSDSRNGRAGLGWFGESSWGSGSYQIEDGSFGIPFIPEIAEEGENGETIHISLAQRREVLRAGTGFRSRDGFVESVKATVSRIRYRHTELENFVESGETEVGTRFENTTTLGRLELHQRPIGGLTGQFGLWGQRRNYVVAGDEALSPPTHQNALAGFVYEEIALNDASLQFGARLEHNGYEPESRDAESLGVPATRDRSFTGLSGSLGLRLPFASERAAVVLNLGSSYRAPALEELYNFGPHVGNLAFEIGDPDLGHERSNGGEVSLRFNGTRLHGEVNVFYYSIRGYIFAARTGEIEDGLQIVEYEQGDARYVGFDMSARVHLGPQLQLLLSGGLVDARLTDSDEPLPRIPPFSGRAGLDWSPDNRWLLRPEFVVAARQDQVHTGELPTDGYMMANVLASYTLPKGKVMQVFTLKVSNIANVDYRNHTSLIKDFVPEMGRRLLLTYALRLF